MMNELKELKPLKDSYKMTFYPKGREFEFTYSSRVLNFFGAMDDIADISQFVKGVGIWENFSVARGMDTDAVCKRKRRDVIASIDCLLSMLSTDEELYTYNYEYKAYNERYSKKSWSHCNISGKKGGLEVYTGLLYFKYYSNGRRLDLRQKSSFETVSPNNSNTVSEVIIGKRKNHCRLLEKISDLKDLVSKSDGKEIAIRHHYV